MPIYLTIGSIPELKGLPAKEQRRLWRAAYGRSFENWRTWAALALVGLFGGVGSYVGLTYGHQILGGAIGAGIGGALYGQIAVSLVRPYLRGLPDIERRA
jgi:hypothetical protein